MLELANNLPLEIVEEIIMLSEQERATGKAVIRATADNPDIGITLLDAVRAMQAADNLPERGLKELLCTLSQQQIVELTALMWLGRGDYPGIWGKTVREAFAFLCEEASANSGAGDIRYLMEKPLKLYLEAAMQLDPNGIVPG